MEEFLTQNSESIISAIYVTVGVVISFFSIKLLVNDDSLGFDDPFYIGACFVFVMIAWPLIFAVMCFNAIGVVLKRIIEE